MKLFLFLFCGILLFSCATTKKYKYDCYRDSYNDGTKFYDSLLTIGVDTIITYYDGCSGCMSGLDKPYFVFWVKNGKSNLTKFTGYSTFNILNNTFNIYCIDTLKYSFNSPIIEPNFGLEHYPYEIIQIKIDSFQHNYKLTIFQKDANELHSSVLFIDKFRSFILKSEGYWRGLSYKRIKSTDK